MRFVRESVPAFKRYIELFIFFYIDFYLASACLGQLWKRLFFPQPLFTNFLFLLGIFRISVDSQRRRCLESLPWLLPTHSCHLWRLWSCSLNWKAVYKRYFIPISKISRTLSILLGSGYVINAWYSFWKGILACTLLVLVLHPSDSVLFILFDSMWWTNFQLYPVTIPPSHVGHWWPVQLCTIEPEQSCFSAICWCFISFLLSSSPLAGYSSYCCSPA